MDIRVAITRTGVFLAVYTLVLGLPFAVAIWFKPMLISMIGAQWWIFPLGLMAILATVGPFVYIYIRRKAEARLLREQKKYQDTLKQASVGMTRIRNLRKLLSLIAHIVTRSVKISFAAIYLYHKEANAYVLEVSRDRGIKFIPQIGMDNPLLAWLLEKKEPLVYEEIKRELEENATTEIRNLEAHMRLLHAAVVIPASLKTGS